MGREAAAAGELVELIFSLKRSMGSAARHLRTLRMRGPRSRVLKPAW